MDSSPPVDPQVAGIRAALPDGIDYDFESHLTEMHSALNFEPLQTLEVSGIISSGPVKKAAWCCS